MEKLISVVIPVFNGEKYIQETLDSIYIQSYKNYELVVVDGGSTDSTLEILHENERIDKIISEKDNGMYDALEKGFKVSKGEILCYINSDDKLLPHAFESVIQKFDENEFDLVYGNVNYLSERGEVIYTYKALYLSHKAIKALKRLPFAQQSAFWTKELHNQIGGFDKNLKYVADSKFFLTACLSPKTRKGYINKTLGEYRLHNNSFSVGSLIKMKEEHALMKKEFEFDNSMIKLFYYEFLLKSINAINIFKKKLYKGPKF